MSSLKYYVADYNGILTDLKQKLTGHLTTPRYADAWIVWQDVLGSYSDLLRASKQTGLVHRSYCVQHGRGSTLDYGPPNNFTGEADKYLAWGTSDYNRMVSLGLGNKTKIVGCPLNSQILPRIPHKEKVVLFVPVNTGKEEPENIAAYYELLKIKYSKAQFKVLSYSRSLKDKWSFDDRAVSFNDLSVDFDVVAKLLPWHDEKLYHGRVIKGFQYQATNNAVNFSLLRNVDLVIGLDEGTTEAFAYGHDVPVITVDGFTYRQHGHDDRKYELMDIYRTKASTHVKLADLSEAVTYALAHPEHLRQERAEVAENELGISAGNAVDNIIKEVRSDFRS